MAAAAATVRSPRARSLQAAGSAIVGSSGALTERKYDTRLMTLESGPVVVLEKKIYTNLGRTPKFSLGMLRMQEYKTASEAMMQSLENRVQVRFAKQEKIERVNLANKRSGPVEVLEFDGSILLGVPGTSRLQYHSVQKDHKGQDKQIVIAMHALTNRKKAVGGKGNLPCTLSSLRSCPS